MSVEREWDGAGVEWGLGLWLCGGGGGGTCSVWVATQP